MLHNLTCAAAGAILLLAGLPAVAQFNVLPYKPVDVGYSRPLDRLVMAAASQLHLYDPVNKLDGVIVLAHPAVSLSVSPDGRFAAVGHNKYVSYVNLMTASVVRVIETDVEASRVLLLPGYVVVVPTGLLYTAVTLRLAAVTDPRTTVSDVTLNGAASFQYQLAARSDGAGFYLGIFSPQRLNSFRIIGGKITRTNREIDSSSGGWLFGDDRLIQGCGEAYRSSAEDAKDLVYAGSLGVETHFVGYSPERSELGVIPGDSHYCAGALRALDTEVRLYESRYLTQTGRWVLPPFPSTSGSVVAHAKKVFYNSTGDKLFVIAEGETSQANNMAVAVYRFGPACGTTLNASTAQATWTGAWNSVDTYSEAECLWTASANVPWIIVESGTGGASRKVTYFVGANPTVLPRTGVVTIGNKTLTVTQDGRPATIPAWTPLPYAVVHAAYSRSVDRLVIVSADPNQLLLYKGASGEEAAAVRLPLAPRLVAVSPDGNTAAVGHDGWISRVNLVSAQVEEVFPIDLAIQNLSLSGSHAFIGVGRIRSIDMSTGAEVPLPQSEDDVTQTVVTPDGTSLIGLGGGKTRRWRLSGGVPTLERVSNEPACTLFAAADSARVYTGCGTALKLSQNAAEDLRVEGKLAETIRHIADVPSRTAVFALAGSWDAGLEVTRYHRGTLAKQSTFPLPVVEDSPGVVSYSDGQHIFANRDGDRLVVLTKSYPPPGTLVWSIFSASVDNPPVCEYSVEPKAITVSAAGGDMVKIRVKAQYNCDWTATSSAEWATVWQPKGVEVIIRSGNTGPAPRTATIQVAGQTVTITQPGHCSYGINYTGVYFPAAGGTQTLSLTTGDGCPWTAAVTKGDWFTVSPSSGTGSGTLTFTAGPTPGPFRNGSVNAAGRTLDIGQHGSATACSIRPDWLFSNPPNGHSGVTSLSVTGNCPDGFRILSSPPWLQIYPLSSPTALTSVSFTVFPHFGSKARWGYLELNTGERYQIWQAPSMFVYDYRFVGHLYFGSFGRLAAGSEVNFQVNEALKKGVTEAELAVNFLSTPEFNQGGRFIAGLYAGLLNRNAEYGGWLFQRNALATGKVDQKQLVTNFLNSAEWKNKYGTPSNADFVKTLYRQVLLREPSAAEVQFQVNALAGGFQRVDMATAFLNAPEFRAGVGPRLTAFLIYATLLSRDPSPAEMAAQVNAIQGGVALREIAAELLASAELRDMLN